MDKETYPVEYNVLRLKYDFLSIGPQGEIKKSIRFKRIIDNLFAVAFGDWNDLLEKIDDQVRSNNYDRDKVLATVADVVFEFLRYYPQARIYVKGSTPARTRLYQMSIKANWHIIGLAVDIQGYVNGRWQLFEKEKNYEAFMVKIKSKK